MARREFRSILRAPVGDPSRYAQSKPLNRCAIETRSVGGRRSKCFERTSLRRPERATAVTERKPLRGQPVQGSRIWLNFCPPISNCRSEVPEVERDHPGLSKRYTGHSVAASGWITPIGHSPNASPVSLL